MADQLVDLSLLTHGSLYAHAQLRILISQRNSVYSSVYLTISQFLRRVYYALGGYLLEVAMNRHSVRTGPYLQAFVGVCVF